MNTNLRARNKSSGFTKSIIDDKATSFSLVVVHQKPAMLYQDNQLLG